MNDPVEFANIVVYIGLATGKPLSAEAQVVYFDLLGDIDSDILWTAAKRVLLEHKWATFPLPAALREAAMLTAQSKVVELSAAEAWKLAWAAEGRIDLEVEGKLERALKCVPPIVVEAMNAYGIASFCDGKTPVGVIRKQFMEIYEQLVARNRRRGLMTPKVINAIQGRIEPLAEPVRLALENVGKKA